MTSATNSFRAAGPTFKVDIPRGRTPDLVFITSTNLNDAKTSANRKTVRKQAKRAADRRSREQTSGKIEKLDSHADCSPAILHAAVSFGSDGNIREARTQGPHDVEPAYDTAPITADRPRSNQPSQGAINPDVRQSILAEKLQQLSRDRPLRTEWMSIALDDDDDNFQLNLTHAAVLSAQSVDHVLRTTGQCRRDYAQTVGSVLNRLHNPDSTITQGLLGSVLGLANLDMTNKKWERSRMHMKGFVDLLSTLDGSRIFASCTALQRYAFWVDMTGGILLDAVPFLPIPPTVPVHMERHRSLRLTALLSTLTSTHQCLEDIAESFALLSDLAAYAEIHNISQSRGTEESYIALQVHAVAHRLLSAPRLPAGQDARSVTQSLLLHEILRLASILFIGVLKQGCNVPSSGAAESRIRLGLLLVKELVDWGPLMELRLWVTTILALSKDEERDWAVEKTVRTIQVLQLAGWQAALEVLKELIWVGNMFDLRATTLGNEVEAGLASSLGI